MACITRFSILYRIEGGATASAAAALLTAQLCFSILYRIEGGATALSNVYTPSLDSFSILYRIEGGATISIRSYS